MKRQSVIFSNAYGANNTGDNVSSRQPGGSHQASTPNQPVYSQMPHLPHGSIPSHQLYSQTSHSPHRYDPRPVSMVNPLQRAHGLPGSSMHLPGPQSYQPRRVSLLRDIGKAGERDRDHSTTASVTEGQGLSSLYSGNTSSRHHSTTSQSVANYNRPITILEDMTYAYQQRLQDTSHLRTPLGAHSISSVDTKKDSSLLTTKQEIGSKASLAQINHPTGTGTTTQPMPSMLQRQSSISMASKTDLSLSLLTGFEQRSKEDLLQSMEKVDKELSKVAAEITRLQKRKTQLEESAKKPNEADKEESLPQTAEPKPRDLWQIIYAENRKKAESARTILDGICPIYDMPLYNQPSDTKVFQDNLKKNEEMRPKLLRFFQHRQKLSNIREKYLSARYDQMKDEWQRKTEKIENNIKRKTKEAKTREFFEKIFPEIRKQREQQERVERVGTRGDTCRSDADFAEIVDGLSEQENQLQHMRQLAVVPPMLLDKEERRVVFINNNGFINDAFADFKETQQLDAWADQEKATFKEKYVLHPKNFQMIASFIEKKSVSDCILYYYLTKKANNYKGLVRKHSLKPRKPKSGRAHTSHHSDQSATANTTKENAEKTDKEGIKKEVEPEIEEAKFDKPPSPRMTRARKQTMNWTEEEINLVKEGFGKHGRDFSSISRMVTNKSEQQVKNFYNNYKKKHGLDQLIIDSKKKKTRTRHTALSPETAVDEDLSRKATDLLTTETKQDKEKPDELVPVDDKKKQKDLTPSPAVTGVKTDPTDTTVLTGSPYTRTRRAIAALAAAANQDNQDKDSNLNKRPTEKSQAATGEPTEKKTKKNERKSRGQKTTETARSELAKSEAVKDVVASLSAKSTDEEKLENPSEPEEQKKSVDDPSKQESSGNIKDAENIDKKESQTMTKTTKVDDNSPITQQTAKTIAAVQKASEDRDSSATCSADEDNPNDVMKSQPTRPPHVPSPYWFDDSPNDSLTIRLERGRQPGDVDVTSSSTLPSVTSSIIQATTSSVLNLSSNIQRSVVSSANDEARPQSLPPAATSPAVTVQPASSSQNLTGLDLSQSRPSSTPVCPELAASKKQVSYESLPQFNLTGYRQDRRPSDVFIPNVKATLVSTTPVNVRNIGDLTYTGSKVTVKTKPSITPVHSQVPSVVDLTRDTAAKISASTIQQAAHQVIPISKHQYHVAHPLASSLQKDFQPLTMAAPSAPVMSIPFSQYQRVYSDKDKQAMKDRAAHIPEAAAPIPVSSLRFTTASSKSVVLHQPHQRATVSTTTSQFVPSRQPPIIKQEINHSPIVPSVSTNPLFSTIISAPVSRVTQVSPYPRLTSVPSIYQLPDKLETTATAEEKVIPKHVAIPGGSITQGKPVFRTQTSNNNIQDVKGENQKVIGSSATTARGSIVQGTPSPALVSSTGLPSNDPFKRSTDHPEALLNPQQGLHLQGPSFPGFIIPPQIKGEKTNETHPKGHAVTSSYSQSIDPRYLLNPAMQGMSTKVKGLEENFSKIQRSTPPPQGKILERKSSYVPPTVTEMPPRKPSPLIHYNIESHHKEDIKRPSSTSRATPERRSVPEKPPTMPGHHRVSSTPHLVGTPKLRNSPAESKQRLEDAYPPTIAEQQLMQAFINQSILSNLSMAHLDPIAIRNLLGQYGHAGAPYPLLSGFPPPGSPSLIRPFSPVPGTDGRDSSHSVLAHDFATAQLMQQPNLAGLTSPRSHPYGATLPPAIVPPGQPVAGGIQSGLLPQRHSNSPTSLERLNFIPQHGSSPLTLTSRASPHRTDPSKTPNPQSPSSPHLSMKSQLQGFIPSSQESVYQRSERRHSRSPHLASPSAEQRAFASLAGSSLPHDGRQASPLIYPKHPVVSKPSLSMPESLSSKEHMLSSIFGSSTGQIYRKTNSPLAAQVPRSKSVKQEHILDVEPSRHVGDVARPYARSPDLSTHHSLENRGVPRWEPHRTSVIESSQKLKLPSGAPNLINDQRSASAGERKGAQVSKRVSTVDGQQQGKVAKDLKTTGRTKLTPKMLINTIIDHNINQYAAQNKTMQVPGDHASVQTERKPLDGKSVEKIPEAVDSKLLGVSTKSTSSRTTTLQEHSSDIISNMYRTEKQKQGNSETKPGVPLKNEGVASLMTSNQRFPTAPFNDQFLKSLGRDQASMVLALSPQTPNNQLESIIRKALMDTNPASSIASSPPINEAFRQARSSASLVPGVRSSSLVYPAEKIASASYQGSPQEQKRTESHFGVSSPNPNVPPQMYSALSFRKNPSSLPTQQIPPPANIANRGTVLPVPPSTPVMGSSSGYHSQTSVSSERTPLPANEYEPLSEDES